LVLVLSGKRDSDHWENLDTRPLQNYDFYDLKGCLEGLFQDLHLSAHEFVPATHPFLHPGKSAEVKHRGQVLACLGELHPRVAESFGLGATPVQVAEVYLEPLLAALPVRHPYLSFSRYPAALRDIAVIVPEETPAVVVEKEIRSGGGDLIQAVRLFDVYRGDSIPTGTKSLAYSLGYQASDRTLSDKEVEKAHKGVENRLRHVLKARIRGQDT
ncbi:MAG: phenylalanine--tRNA ligase subunit beta, partial [Gemmataceae bacterium]